MTQTHRRRNAPTPKREENRRASDLMDRSGLSGIQIASALTAGTGRTYDQTIISKMRKDRRIQEDEMRVLDGLATRVAEEAKAFSPVVRLTDTTDSVPLFGYANAAGNSLRLSEDHIVRPIPIHPAQVGSRGAFAVYVSGDSMNSKLEDGDIAFAIRNLPPTKGQTCIIEMHTGEAVVKIYDGMDEHTVFARQLNPVKRLSYARRDVANVYRVVGTQFGS